MRVARSRAPALVAVIALVCASLGSPAQAAAPLTSWLANVGQTSAALQDVLALHERSLGKQQDSFATQSEEWRVVESGVTGTLKRIAIGSDYLVTRARGPITTMHGRYRGQLWKQNENGLTVAIRGVHQQDAVSAEALKNARTSPVDGVTLIGETSSPATYVVEVNPSGGRHEWYFFDKTTGRTVHSEALYAGRRIVSSYDDFRTTDGAVEPWHVMESDGRPKNDQEWTLLARRFNVTLDQHNLEIPADRRQLVEFPANKTTVRLPSRIVGGHIIVRLTIQDRGLDFLLDSGASGIFIDKNVAQELKLRPITRSVGETLGEYESGLTLVPEIRIGELRMTGVAVESLPFHYNPQVSTKVVGLIGFDFIASAVVRVDYEHGAVDAIQREAFAPPEGALAMPIVLDDLVPIVHARINEAEGDHFILDTGADDILIFPGFAEAHSEAVRDRGLGRTVASILPVISASGVGGRIDLRPVQVDAFYFGTIRFSNWLVNLTVRENPFGTEDFDGLIGYTFLRFFNLYFDYDHSRIILQRNGLRR